MQSTDHIKARKMVALATLAQNCALGLSFGSYGALIPSFEKQFDASRGMASTGIGLLVATLSLSSPVLGAWLRRLPLRGVMVTGALLHVAGYLLLSMAGSMVEVIAIYGLLIGPGGALLGAIPASTLVGNWVTEGRGKALGIVNMPILLLLTPPAAAFLLQRHGMVSLFHALALMAGLCALLMLLVRDRPVDNAAPATKEEEEQEQEDRTPPLSSPAPATLTSATIVRSTPFWLLSLGVGLVAAGGTMITAHLIPLATSRGITLEAASLLLSVYAGAGLLGAPLFGGVVDRLGARAGLAINAVMQMLCWAALLLLSDFTLLLVAVALIGLCATSILAIHSAAIAEIFGPANIAAVFGMSYLPKLLFIFGAAPLAGFLFDLANSYTPALLVHITLFAIAALAFLLLPGMGAKKGTRAAHIT